MKVADPAQHNHPKTIFLLLAIVITLGVGASIAQPTLLSGPSVVPGPSDVTTSGYTNSEPQVFNETQAVTLQDDLACDTTIIPAGTKVNSHMIIYHTPTAGLDTKSAEWIFENDVLCIISSSNGLAQALTDPYLGLSGTTYGGVYSGRGKEGDDTVLYSGNQVTATLTAEPTGDRIRVITGSTEVADSVAPVVYCEATDLKVNDQSNKKDGSGENLLTLLGADDVDGPVDLFLTDTESGEEFGPFAVGTTIKHTIAKGAAPSLTEAKNENQGDYLIKTQGALEITATDEAGNTGVAACS